jgi:hypothetical protein
MQKTLAMVGLVLLCISGCRESYTGQGASADPNTSDSNLMGAWRADGDGYRGKLVEITADRTTRQFAARGEIDFTLKVSGNAFEGMASATFFDPSQRRIKGPVEVKMEGERVLP